MRINTSALSEIPRRVPLKMLGTTTRLVFAILIASLLFSMHRINTFYTHHFTAEMMDQSEMLSSPSKSQKNSLRASIDHEPTKQANDQNTWQSVEETPSSILLAKNHSELISDFVSSDKYDDLASGDDDSYDNAGENGKRAIVIISMGEEASNASLVERFVWSARNIGKFNGWIILITDADENRYENLVAATIPESNVVRIKTQLNSNIFNNFMVFRTEEKRFAKMSTSNKKFKAENTMNSKIFKTHILKFAQKELRLSEIELFYYLDVDIVFGNPIQPLFTNLEQRYNIGSLYKKNVEEDIEIPTVESEQATIYFFEGNGSQQIQGGQFVLDRENSQPCLDRWRKLMIKQRNRRYLKDQRQLTMMLDEQRKRVKENAINGTSAQGPTNSTSKGSNKNCEIVLMKQDNALIQFPELKDIKNRASNKEHPVLVHFRNSANVMRDVDDELLQLYMRDILRFEENQEDEHGILNKMLMKVDAKKSF